MCWQPSAKMGILNKHVTKHNCFCWKIRTSKSQSPPQAVEELYQMGYLCFLVNQIVSWLERLERGLDWPFVDNCFNKYNLKSNRNISQKTWDSVVTFVIAESGKVLVPIYSFWWHPSFAYETWANATWL